MLHKLPKYLVWIGAFLFVAMFPVGELCAQNNLETLTNKDLFCLSTQVVTTGNTLVAQGRQVQGRRKRGESRAVLYQGGREGRCPCAVCPEFVLQRRIWSQPRTAERSMPFGYPSRWSKNMPWRRIFWVWYILIIKKTADYKKALAYYKKAALQGYSEAQYNVGWCYFNGYGVEADQEEAMRLDKKGGRAGICFGLGRHVAGLLFRCERFAS